jgi:4-amino-4-deoxy-L-arabinose transferase-like glycosyltransferase
VASINREAGARAPRPAWFPVALVLLLAFAARLLHLGSALRSPLSFQPGPDEAFYAAFGRAVASGGALDPVFAFMDPGYGYLLGAVYRLFGDGLFPVYLLQALVDTGTAALVYLIGRELGAPRAGLVGAGAYALTSSAILLATTLQKETWVAHFCAWFAFLAVRLVRDERRWPWVAFGVLCGVGVALRSNLLLAPAMACLLLPFAAAPGQPRRRVVASLWLLAVGLALPLLLLSARNASLSGTRSPLPNNGGVVLHQLYNASNPDSLSGAPPFVTHYHPVEIWRGYAAEARRRLGGQPTPHEVDRYWRGEALAYLRAHPGQALRNVVRKTGEFLAFQEVPNNRSMADERLFSPVLRWLPLPFGWLLAFGLPGLWLAWRRDRRAVLAAVPVVVAAATVAVFFAEDRFRAPAVPMLAVGVGLLADRMLSWWARRDLRALALAMLAATAIGVASWLSSRHLPAPTVSWDRIAWGYIRMGRIGEAREVAETRLRARPGDATLLEALAYVAVAQGRDAEAIARYRAALAIRPASHVAHYNLARVLARAGRVDEALAEAREAARLSPQADYLELVRELERKPVGID